jgi:glutamyl-Q tRNA(Asp) synthetase
MTAYIGRFAPSPTGPLHAGSLVAALASWLDARAHAGRWLVRIEDVDKPRCVVGADRVILAQLAACGLMPDEPVLVQSRRADSYQRALDSLIAAAQAYPCGCSRKDIKDALAARGMRRPRHGELVYPGTCRDGLHGRCARAWRFLTQELKKKEPVAIAAYTNHATTAIANPVVTWHDRRLGAQQQDVAAEVGDFVLKRADGLWAYQLAVVVDDAAQGITHVVRGADLADNTPRQILLQRALQLPTPSYLHTPLVRGADGNKLSKQNGAQALDTAGAVNVFNALAAAAAVLGLAPHPGPVAEALAAWVLAWRHLYNLPSS